MAMNLNKKLITDAELQGRRVVMRVDFNVPMNKQGEITNNQRIVGAIPTIQYALKQGAKSVVLMSHMGRPDGKPNTKDSLKPVADRLQELLGKPVTFLKDCVGKETVAACKDPAPGTVFLLENLRFHIEEEGTIKPPKGSTDKPIKATEKETAAFRKSLSSLGDVYVNDAFGTAHRAHSSMVGVDLADKVAGLLIQKELAAFAQVLTSPQTPLVAIVGGAKISDKIKLIDNLIEKAQGIIICGGMAYTFLKVCHGMEIGKSLFDKAGAEIVQSILDKAKAKGVEVTLPVDWICGQEFKNDQETKLVTQAEGIPDGWEGMDCGPESIKLFESKIKKAKTVVWNGPAGVFEFEKFSKGTNAILKAVAKLHASGGRGIIGGGDSATAAANAGMEDKVSFVSTGGGASLELLEGKHLPGIVALQDRPTEVKVTNKKGIGFYVRAARNFLVGVEAKEAEEAEEGKPAKREILAKDGEDAITVSGLGDAISCAAAVATTLEKEGVCKIAKIQTLYPDFKNGSIERGVAQIRIRLEKK